MDAIYLNYRPVFLFVNKYIFPSKWYYPSSRTPYCMFRYIISGMAMMKINDEEYRVNKDDILYIPQGSRLECHAIEPIEFISVRFIGSIQPSNTDILKSLFNIPHLNHYDHPDIKRWFEELYTSAISRKTYKMLLVMGYLNLITATLAQYASNQDESEIKDSPLEIPAFSPDLLCNRQQDSLSNTDNRINHIVDYLITHPTENLSIEQLCRMANLSESSLRRLFKRQTGKAPHEYIQELKMMTAARMLLINTDRISDIAYTVGFESSNYFSRCFTNIFGVSPQEYRKQSQNL